MQGFKNAVQNKPEILPFMGQCSHRRSCTGLGKGMCLLSIKNIFWLQTDFFFIKPSIMVISYNPLPLFSPQRGIQDVHIESDQGGHTLHLVSRAFKLFNRKKRIRRLKREFSSCGVLFTFFPFSHVWTGSKTNGTDGS